jgi:hypothetical protein
MLRKLSLNSCLLSFLCLIFPASCTYRTFIANNMSGTLGDMEKAFYKEKSVRFAREAIPAMIKQLDGFIESSPENADLLTSGARMNCGVAFMFIDDEDPALSSILYIKGLNYALRALETDVRGFKKYYGGDLQEFEKFIGGNITKKEQVPATFWAGNCLGGYINVNREDIGAVADIPKAEILVKHALNLNELYFYSGAHLFFGIFNGSLPAMLGGNPQESKMHFEKLIEQTKGNFLLGKVMYASTYAVQVQDRKLYEKLLSEVLESENYPEEFNLINAAAKAKAEKMIKQADEKFIEDTTEEK